MGCLLIRLRGGIKSESSFASAFRMRMPGAKCDRMASGIGVVQNGRDQMEPKNEEKRTGPERSASNRPPEKGAPDTAGKLND